MYSHCDQSEGRLPSIWAERLWDVYIDAQQHLKNAIQYVEQNSLKEGKKFQDWSFVTKTK
ncbi:hypothetical protein Mal48_14140 [Thalassoglobus polymorphus]|uniref:Transposase IS200-like domain-containing protein n=1 Tax=Thalassoglobus polymorphus TaxID=2527994 RepID=A0A517QKK7_9PLAN|nr:hypothetical protein Mal48_14140 [Thalassoglobus polymorphus]